MLRCKQIEFYKLHKLMKLLKLQKFNQQVCLLIRQLMKILFYFLKQINLMGI